MSVIDQVKAHGQDSVLRFWNDLKPAQREQLEQQLAAIDWSRIDEWIATYVTGTGGMVVPQNLEPAPYYPALPRNGAEATRYAEAVRVGEGLLAAGKIAAFTVAGGQGTRLGFDAPKGTFPVGPISERSLFQIFAESLLRHGQIHGHAIPWYIMTSPVNDADTREYFAANGNFGLDPANIMYFIQGTMPAFDFAGNLLLGDVDSLALSPDGHGGSLKALYASGAIADMARRGVEHISYFQVDNPLVSVVDPLFLGLHHLDQSDMSSRTLLKNDPFEKVGCFCVGEGKTQVVEYSDLPAELATARDAAGGLRFIAGSPAIHVISRAFVERLNAGGGFALPFHRAVKKIPHVDATGALVEPATPNGVKLETFVFDALPLAERTMILEALREEEFGPVKNKTGVDSVDSARRLLQEKYARWFASRGIDLPRQADGELALRVEIAPRRYVTLADFATARLENLDIQSGDDICIM